ncbi:UNVERIFIED_CONTAM: hypothetical protein FKN15_007715 [Acipenser sinensis]
MRKACPRKEARAETGQDHGDACGEEVEGVGGEREEELAPAPQPQSEPMLTEEAAIQKETGEEPPTPRPRTKRPSRSLSLTGSEDNTATTENGEEPFKVVAKKKRFQQKAAELPDGRAQPVQNSEPVQTGRLRAQDGESVPPNAEEENTAEGEPDVVQDSPLAESQPPETVTAEAETVVEESAAAEEGSAERQGAGQAEGVRGAQVEESAETPVPAPRVKKRIAAEEQSTVADPPTESTVQEPPADPEGSFTAVIKKKKMQKRSEAVVVGESIWGPVAAHKGSGEPQLAAPGEPSHGSLVGGDAGSQPSAAAVGESGPGESGGDGSDQAVAAELPRTGKEANGSAGLASSDAMALPSAESSRPEEDDLMY